MALVFPKKTCPIFFNAFGEVRSLALEHLVVQVWGWLSLRN
jgi:hypothetical protein